MSNSLEIDLVLNRTKYSKIYQVGYMLLFIIVILLIMAVTLKYEMYFKTIARVTDNYLEVMIPLDNLEYLNNGVIIIDNKRKKYKIAKINKELYIGNDYLNYVYVYLDVDGLKKIDNYVYQIKISKGQKLLIKYLKDYFK